MFFLIPMRKTTVLWCFFKFDRYCSARQALKGIGDVGADKHMPNCGCAGFGKEQPGRIKHRCENKECTGNCKYIVSTSGLCRRCRGSGISAKSEEKKEFTGSQVVKTGVSLPMGTYIYEMYFKENSC